MAFFGNAKNVGRTISHDGDLSHLYEVIARLERKIDMLYRELGFDPYEVRPAKVKKDD